MFRSGTRNMCGLITVLHRKHVLNGQRVGLAHAVHVHRTHCTSGNLSVLLTAQALRAGGTYNFELDVSVVLRA